MLDEMQLAEPCWASRGERERERCSLSYEPQDS